jgi:hypothetical protein
VNIWQFQERVSRRLTVWALFSIVTGLLMRFGNKFWRGVGGQFIGWGFVNLMIAVFGQSAANQRNTSYDNPAVREVRDKERRSLGRALWFNAGLDVLYILGGRAWAGRDKGDGSQSGNGVGVMIQGAFLLVFDIVHGLALPKDDEEQTHFHNKRG